MLMIALSSMKAVLVMMMVLVIKTTMVTPVLSKTRMMQVVRTGSALVHTDLNSHP